MPSPAGFVVKNGLNIFSFTSSGIPVPLSRILISTRSPRFTGGRYKGWLVVASIRLCTALGRRVEAVRNQIQKRPCDVLREDIGLAGGRVKLAELTTPKIYDFDANMRKAGTSLAMRRKIITNVKTMLSFAQGKGLVAQNVATAVRIKSDERNSSTGPLRAGSDFPTRAELNLAIEKATGRWRPLIVTAIFYWYTGQRAARLAVA